MKTAIDKSEFKRKAYNIGVVIVLGTSFVVSTMLIIALALIIEAY